MCIFMLILLLYVITILAIKSSWKEYKKEVEKDKEYYKKLDN